MSYETDPCASFRAQFVQSAESHNKVFSARICRTVSDRPMVAVNERILSDQDYTISNAGENLTVVELALAPNPGDRITVWTNPEVARNSQFLPGQPIEHAALKEETVKWISSLVNVSNQLRSSLRFAATDALHSRCCLPTRSDRAGCVLGFDSHGVLLAQRYVPPPTMVANGPLLLDETAEGERPELRPNGSNVSDGDLVRDSQDGTLYARASASWIPTFAAVADYLAYDGTHPLSGSLSLYGHAAIGIGTVAGRSIAVDGEALDNHDRLARNSLVHHARLTERNAWDFGFLTLSAAGHLAGLYLDDFDTDTGIAREKNSGLAVWNDLDCGTITVGNAGRDAVQTGSSSTFQFIATQSPRSAGRYYAEIMHLKSYALASAYTWHGIRLTNEPAVTGNPPPPGYILCNNDGDVFDGFAELPRTASFTAVWPDNHVPDETVGTVAVDIDRGFVWLGFVDEDLKTWWYGDGNPTTGQNPTAKFPAGRPVLLAGGLWGGSDYALRLNAGQNYFRGAVPEGFRDGWHDGDADTLASRNVFFDGRTGTCRPQSNFTTQLDPTVDWSQTPRWYGYRNPVVTARSYLGRPSWVLETGGGGSPTMLHHDWDNTQNLNLVNATQIDVAISVASSHMTSSGAGYGTNLQTCWVNDHDAPVHYMQLGAYLLGGKVQSLYHPGGSVTNPCPAFDLSDDTWYRLEWRLTKEAGFIADHQILDFLIDGALAWSGSFTANDALAVDAGVWAGSYDGLQVFHQHDGYPYWTSAISEWTVRSSFDMPKPMTLYSPGLTCEDFPEHVRIMADFGNLNGLLENEDFLIGASRDDGSTWHDVVLSRSEQIEPDRWILRGGADLLGTPEGRNLRIRLQTFNEADPVLHRWVMTADTLFIS